MSAWIDVSRALTPTLAVFPGDTPFLMEKVRAHERDGYQLSELRMGAHCGTHMDAPLHFIQGGADMAHLDIDLFMGDAYFAPVRTAEDVLALPQARRYLLRDEGLGGLDERCAQALLDKGARVIGTDRLTISNDRDIKKVHVLLLSRQTLIIETLALDALDKGWYDMAALPLCIPGAEGAPARVLVRPAAQKA